MQSKSSNKNYVHTERNRQSHVEAGGQQTAFVCTEPEGQKDPGINIFILPTVTHQLEENKSYGN